jgi:hypothetical protein
MPENQTPPKSNAPTGKPGSGKESKAKMDAHLHTIKIEDLIVHRYAEHEALFKKADKIARKIIEGELREGEGMRALAPGTYQIFFPKLTPDAGGLRCSVIAEQVAREVRNLNPTSMALERDKDNPAQPARPNRGTHRSVGSRGRQNPLIDDDTAAAHREAATRAVAAMTVSGGEEISITDHEREALSALKMVFHPVWYTKNNLITGYYCDITLDGHSVTPQQVAKMLESSNVEIATAKLDATIYKQAAEAIDYLLNENLKALLIVPVHFSTIDRLRFMGPFLEGAGQLPQETKELLVFEMKGLPSELSRFRLREPVSYLRSRARALLARTGFEAADLNLFKELGFHGISVAVNEYDWREDRLLKGLERFVEGAETHKLQSFVHSIKSKSLDHPQRIRPYEIDMLFES